MLVLKDVSRPRLKPGSSGGEKSSNQTSTLQTAASVIQVKRVYLLHFITSLPFKIIY